MGVWIETVNRNVTYKDSQVTPCMGVWIETFESRGRGTIIVSHPVWVCGLKQQSNVRMNRNTMSHPVWVCGLKLYNWDATKIADSHTLYGCVD